MPKLYAHKMILTIEEKVDKMETIKDFKRSRFEVRPEASKHCNVLKRRQRIEEMQRDNKLKAFTAML